MSVTLTPSPLQWRKGEEHKCKECCPGGVTAPGLQPFTTDQGDLPICSSESLAKVILAWLDAKGFEAKQRDILQSLLNIFGEKLDKKTLDLKTSKCPAGAAVPKVPTEGKFLCEFNNRQVGVKVTRKIGLGSEVENEDSTSNITIKVNIKVQPTDTKGQHWEPSENKKMSSPADFLAVGCLKPILVDQDQKKGRHAVYIQSYNPKTWKVEAINSWGNSYDKLDTLMDSLYYQVNLIQLEIHSENIAGYAWDEEDSSKDKNDLVRLNLDIKISRNQMERIKLIIKEDSSEDNQDLVGLDL